MITKADRGSTIQYIRMKLLADGLAGRPTDSLGDGTPPSDIACLLSALHDRLRLVGDVRCPADQRIESFLSAHFAELGRSVPLRLPGRTLVLDRAGLAREMSLPVDGDFFSNEHLSSYRVKNGVLHNPRLDRRTTLGTFHVAEGGLPIAADKKAVPKRAFAELFNRALRPPGELMLLPFASQDTAPIETLVSLLIRPLVAPEVAQISPEKRMEIRFFAPGGLVSNLDFVESIFGNAGNPFLPEHDSALDVNHWTGHTGCVIVAPHLCGITKREARLPHYKEATERQREQQMCWRDEKELYNEGQPFKLTCRDESGVIVTLIADNYYGYCKKEVKTQISYAANLFGNIEEEHAGGAIAFPSYSLGEDFQANSQQHNGRTFADVARDYADCLELQPEGYGIDKQFPDLIYVPENALASLREQSVSWKNDTSEHSIPLLPGKVYMTPSGYRLWMEKHPEAPSWRLIGTLGEGVFCHKPCTVSGGGKSEISKPLFDYMLYGPVFVTDLQRDLDTVGEIFNREYGTRWRPDGMTHPDYASRSSRRVLDPRRSLGSVIKLFTPSPDYTDEYNAWLASIPDYIYSLVFIIKRFQRPDWGDDWRKDFSVDIVNGVPGHELKYHGRKLVGTYLKVGFDAQQSWRTYKLRQDFSPATKLATEDDISVSIVVPGRQLSHLNPNYRAPSYKFVANCESRLFQRPDDAVHRGLDRQAEADLAQSDNFISNFEPLTAEHVREMVKYVVDLDKFTLPMQKLLREVADEGRGYAVCSSMPRLVDGVPSQNPRYLQGRPDLVRPMQRYAAEMSTRLFRAVPADRPVYTPVNTVLFGRRNNPADPQAGIRGLAVYNPLHYQELPELFMDFVCSLTGKSPSTTAAGSEGALTKGPFNALLPIIDLNNALVSFLLTDLAGFSTPAGHIGAQVRVDHDVSLLIPEIWCRMSAEEQSPEFLVKHQFLEPLEDFDHLGERIPASRLGYRMTQRFVRRFFGRVFDNPGKVFDEAILRPESQDLAAFADGVRYICQSQARVARTYFEDGSIDLACPPLRALLTIMTEGTCEGRDLRDPEIRQMFTREHLLASGWYRERLEAKQWQDRGLWQRHVASINQFLDDPKRNHAAERLQIKDRLKIAEAELRRVWSPAYLEELRGMLGLDPAFRARMPAPATAPTAAVAAPA